MDIKFWGARGSSPVTMDHQRALQLVEGLVERAKAQGLKTVDQLLTAARSGALGEPLAYGGHTPCTEVRHDDQLFFVDMGTGLREAGTRYLGKRKEFVVFLTHLHWDHLMGLNFFIPLFAAGHKITIHHVHKHAPEHVRILFNGTNFPVKWEQLGAQVEFKPLTLYQPVEYGAVRVTAFALDHPGGSFGYRFEAGGKALAVGFDGEYTRVTRESLGKDLPFYQNLDLLVFDAQYELDELLHKHDWGHSSAMIGIDLALREHIKTLVLIHHDPWATDARLRQSHANAKKYVETHMSWHTDTWKDQPGGPAVVSAYDGLTLSV